MGFVIGVGVITGLHVRIMATAEPIRRVKVTAGSVKKVRATAGPFAEVGAAALSVTGTEAATGLVVLSSDPEVFCSP